MDTAPPQPRSGIGPALERSGVHSLPATIPAASQARRLPIVFALLLATAAQTVTLAGKCWPLRNGDFSRPGHGWLPAHWGPVTFTGEHKLSMVSSWTKNDPVTRAIIKPIKAGRVCFWQDVHLLKGRYRFSVEVRCGKDGVAHIVVGRTTKATRKRGEWEKIAFELHADDRLRVHLFSVGAGQVEFTNARIDAVRVESAPVPFADGTRLGGIVLPAEPRLSDEFAAWELQNYLYRMTGCAPGLSGRDKTHDGRMVVIGGPTAPGLAQRPRDSYAVKVADDRVVLCGNTPSGTLYAVYEFLKLQGCSWRLPGTVGEEIPERRSLLLPSLPIVESPDYDVRGILIDGQSFFPAGGWIPTDMGECLDWAVRNRMNAVWYGGRQTVEFGAHRGYGHQQTLNHSWSRFLLDDRPEWFVLHRGKRTELHTSRRPNQLCVSNKQLRDQVVATVLRHFEANPHHAAFALNPEDEPCFWCECKSCRALDPDEGKGPWEANDQGWPELSMTDRTLNFVNEVATRVSKVDPDKLIELYAYGAYRKPPQREKVHPDVLVKYTYWPGSNPFGHSLLDGTTEPSRRVVATLDGWQTAGVKRFGLYDYGNYKHSDVPWFSFRHVADTLRTLHDRWGFRHALGETSNSLAQSAVMYSLRAELMWDTSSDHVATIERVCRDLYGPSAETMFAYNTFMHEVLVKSSLWQQKDWFPLAMREYSMNDMERGRAILDKAWSAAGDNGVLQKRLAYARFGHAVMTFTLVQRQDSPNAQAQKAAREAHQLANDLARRYSIFVDQSSVAPLKVLYFRPVVEKVLWELPLTWKFRKDPSDRGLEDEWFRAAPDRTWVDIQTDKSWTDQGHHYHGVAWYQTAFTVPENRRKTFAGSAKRLALHFGAVDGDTDVFLDGTKIGEQKMDVGFMWDKPFAIRLPDEFSPSVPHRVAVRVHKDRFAAGVWRPVMLVTLEDL